MYRIIFSFWPVGEKQRHSSKEQQLGFLKLLLVYVKTRLSNRKCILAKRLRPVFLKFHENINREA